MNKSDTIPLEILQQILKKNQEAQKSKLQKRLPHGNGVVKELKISMCDRIIEKDYGSYLKSLIESSSYDGLKKLEIAGRCLHDTPSLSSIPQHCGLLAPHTKLTRVDIVKTALTPLSRHLPSVEILEFSNCRFKPTSLADEEDIITNFNINVVDTDVGELTMSGTEEQSHTDYFDKMIQEHLLIVIQTENLPRTKYYINVPESTQADEAIDTTTVN